MLVRLATAADIRALMSVEQSAAGASHWSVEQYLALFENPGKTALVALDDEVVGFLVAGRTGEEWEIENIAVVDTSRRKGCGSRLLAEFTRMAREQRASTVFLEVRDSNRAARDFYEKGGFVETGRRKSYYRDPREDAILYTLKLA